MFGAHLDHFTTLNDNCVHSPTILQEKPNASRLLPKFLTLVAILVFSAATAFARQAFHGYCSQGGVVLTVGGVGDIPQPVIGSYPGCFIQVFYSGTSILAPIYQDNAGTVQFNPFQADTTTGAFTFYADSERFDVRQYNGGIPTPFAIGDVSLFDPGYSPTPGTGLTLNLSPGIVNCSGTITFYAGGTLTMAANSTNYVYLDSMASCAPAVSTTLFTNKQIPIATVLAGSSAISTNGITDDRTMFSFVTGGGGGGGGGGGTLVTCTGTGDYAALAAATGSAGKVIIAAGTCALGSNTWTIPRSVSVFGAGDNATFITYTGGAGIVIADAAGGNLYPRGGVHDLRIVGPGTSGTTAGIFMGGGAYSAPTDFGDQYSFYNVSSTNSHYGIEFGNNAFLTSCFNCGFFGNAIGIYSPLGATNQGENLNFHGGAVFNNTTYAFQDNSGAKLNFFGTSLDYSLGPAVGGYIQAEFHGCHFEGSVLPFIDNTGSAGSALIIIDGGEMVMNATTGNFDSFVKIGYCGSGCDAQVRVDAPRFSSQGATVTQLVNYNAVGTLSITNVPTWYGLPYNTPMTNAANYACQTGPVTITGNYGQYPFVSDFLCPMLAQQPTPDSNSNNMILNGDATNGVYSWSNGYTTTVTDTDPWGVSRKVFKNSVSVNFLSPTRYSWIIGADPRQTYVFDFWYKTGGTGSWSMYSANYGDASFGALNAPTAWTHFVITRAIPAGTDFSYTLQPAIVNITSTPDYIEFCDFSVRLVAPVALATNAVTFSATPLFDGTLGNTQTITLTANVTSSTFIGPIGEIAYFKICQDGVGSHTFAWPSNFVGTATVNATAGVCTLQSFYYDGNYAFGISGGGGGSGVTSVTGTTNEVTVTSGATPVVSLAAVQKVRSIGFPVASASAITAGSVTYQGIWLNNTGVTLNITGVSAFEDSGATGSSTCSVALDTGSSLLTGAISTTAGAWTAGTQSATVTIANGHWFNFTYVFDGTAQAVNCQVSMSLP